MSAAPLHLAGEQLMLDPAGVLFWPAQRLLCVADLHLEKGSAWAMRGRPLPPYDSRATLGRLVPLLRRYRPRRLLFLGDSFHDARGAERLPMVERSLLARLIAGCEVIWISGNHDPLPPAGMAGIGVAEWRCGPLTFRHVPQLGAEGEVAGHLHPKARVVTRGGAITRPCFIADERRLVLPAFGAFTGGVDAADPAIVALFSRQGRVFLLGQERLYTFPLAALRPCRWRPPRATPQITLKIAKD